MAYQLVRDNVKIKTPLISKEIKKEIKEIILQNSDKIAFINLKKQLVDINKKNKHLYIYYEVILFYCGYRFFGMSSYCVSNINELKKSIKHIKKMNKGYDYIF